MENKENKEIIFEDISSSSPASVSKAIKQTRETVKDAAYVAKKAADDYGEKGLKNIDKVIKVIAYIVSIAFFLLFLGVAGIVFFLDNSLIFLSTLILVLGGGISLMFLYLIYGLGQIISQNKEILRRLKK